MLVALTVLVCEMVVSVFQFQKDAPTLVRKMDASLDQTNAILKQTYKITTDTRVTLDNLNKAAIDERFYFEKTVPGLSTDVSNLLQTTNSTVAGLQLSTNAVSAQTIRTLGTVSTLLDTTNTTIAGLQPTESAATDSLFKLQTTLSTVNGLLADPNIKTTMFNIAAMTDSGNRMLSTADKVETKATHNYLYPSTNPFVQTWRFVSPFLVPTAQITGALLTK